MGGDVRLISLPLLVVLLLLVNREISKLPPAAAIEDPCSKALQGLMVAVWGSRLPGSPGGELQAKVLVSTDFLLANPIILGRGLQLKLSQNFWAAIFSVSDANAFASHISVFFGSLLTVWPGVLV